MKGKPWKIVGGLAAVGVVLFLLALLKVRAMTEVRWELFRRELTQLAEAERARDFSRSPLRGGAEPGNAWDDYKVAIAAMKKVPAANKVNDLIQRTPKADAAWGAEAVEGSGAVLEPLRRGAQRWTSSFPYEWEKGMSMILPDLPEWVKIGRVAILNARALAEAGRSRDAVAGLLDAAQFGRDAADDGPMISELVGIAILSDVLEAARELAASAKADADALADLDRGLAMLEVGFPKHAGFIRRELLLTGMTLAEAGQGSGFPAKLLTLNAFRRTRESMEERAEACERPWAESAATSQRLEAELQKSWNPTTRLLAPGSHAGEPALRERLAQLRLLRTALRYRRTGERLALADPFGTTLKSAASAGGLKVWSVGRNGVDDGGSGEWLPTVGPDIVLEARR